MKRAIIAAVVGGLVFAVAAFAGGFTVNVAQLNSGVDQVDNCVEDDGEGSVQVSFAVDDYDPDEGDWQIQGVGIDAPSTCDGQDVRIALVHDTGEGLSTECETRTATLDGNGDHTFDIVDEDCLVFTGAVDEVGVLIGDTSLVLSPPGS